MSNDAPVCAGLFGPCSNPPEPECILEDPDGKGPPVHRCRACAAACDAIFGKAKSEGKMHWLEFEIDAARRRTSIDRGQT